MILSFRASYVNSEGYTIQYIIPTAFGSLMKLLILFLNSLKLLTLFDSVPSLSTCLYASLFIIFTNSSNHSFLSNLLIQKTISWTPTKHRLFARYRRYNGEEENRKKINSKSLQSTGGVWHWSKCNPNNNRIFNFLNMWDDNATVLQRIV